MVQLTLPVLYLGFMAERVRLLKRMKKSSSTVSWIQQTLDFKTPVTFPSGENTMFVVLSSLLLWYFEYLLFAFPLLNSQLLRGLFP